ncbi:MAG: hypothetical protein P4M15_15020 [Alphaproteobacteria bacterium]|nr:hypothetical protein [Alphaproteobacteria bacterium]
MILSRTSIEVLSDLIENRLAIMSIGDQDDLREKIVLTRALSELRLKEGGDMPAGVLSQFADIPRRGRRRKVGSAETI